jgi:hypothetical protein
VSDDVGREDCSQSPADPGVVALVGRHGHDLVRISWTRYHNSNGLSGAAMAPIVHDCGCTPAEAGGQGETSELGPTLNFSQMQRFRQKSEGQPTCLAR